MKTIKVVAAVIKKDNKIFATQRGYGDFKDGWEFPGGKIEDGETPEKALKREIKEELDTDIEVGKFIKTIEYDYPKFHLSMDCFICNIKEGSLTLKEHESAKWLTKENLYSVDWLPADKDIIPEIEKEIVGDSGMNELIEDIRIFNEERDWDQFHSEENLAKSIAIEAGELLECFQWNNNYDKDEVCEELADVFTYCLQMAMKLEVKPEDIIRQKLEKTKKKYPVEKAKGVSTKYNKL